MKRLKGILKRCFVLPPVLTVVLAAIGFGLVLAVPVLHVKNPVFQYVSYFASAYALVISVTGFPQLMAAARALRRSFENTAFGGRFSGDAHFRAGVFLHQGFVINLLYITIKLVTGIYCRSAWLVWLAVYYALLAGMRVLLILRLNERDEAAALRRYRLCGILLLFMNQALTALVVHIVQQNRGFTYPGLLIYAMAAYAFYAVIMSVVNMVKTRRLKSPVLSAVRAINLVAAIVSMLALETAMLSQFGGSDSPAFRRIMTGASGGVVCTIVLGMAIYMIISANRKLKILKNNALQT